MISKAASRSMTIIGVGALVLLVGQSFVEYTLLSDRPNPFDHPIGLPAIHEGPFKSTGTSMQVENLPWILDPSDTWTEPQRAMAEEPCGLWLVLAERYPLWAPSPSPAEDPVALCRGHANGERKALQDAGWIDKPTFNWGTRRLMNNSGDILLEQQPAWELALERRGLVIRRRSP
jgi:hypothetical protein